MAGNSFTTEELTALLKMAMAENDRMKEANRRLEMRLKSAERTVERRSKESEHRKHLFEEADKRWRSAEAEIAQLRKDAGEDIEIY